MMRPSSSFRRARAGRRMTFSMVALIVAWVAACAQVDGRPAPRELVEGVDVCEYCHMAIDDPGRAAQWVSAAGEVRIFDEPGCLVAWLAEDPGRSGQAFVGDEGGGGWIAAESASFVRGGHATGMGFGVVAFAHRADADSAAAAAGGRVQSWQELLKEGVRRADGH